MITESLLVIALVILMFAAISKRAEDWPLTPPIFFIAAGCLVSEHGLGLLKVDVSGGSVHLLAEITLVIVLFTDASRIDLSALRRDGNLPARLLAIGMPLTILLGTAIGLWLFPGLGWVEAALLAAILAPTDAALGQAVVSHPDVPVRIRQTLNVESGLNDGIALPLVLFLASMAGLMAGESKETGHWVRFALLAVTLGPLVGGLVGGLGGLGLERGVAGGWVNAPFERLSALGLAFLAFAAAELIGGNGFISAFVAGLALGRSGRNVCGSLHEFGETEGQLLTLLVFLIFGAAIVPEAIAALSMTTLGYALLSLTVVRILPVALALLGSGLRMPSVLFIGWFGPRGLASILFALVVIESGQIAEDSPIEGVVMGTVLLSALLHGMTAAFFARRYGAYVSSAESTEEDRAVTEHPVRVPRSLA